MLRRSSAAERALGLGADRDEAYRVVKLECELAERDSVAPPSHRVALGRQRAKVKA